MKKSAYNKQNNSIQIKTGKYTMESTFFLRARILLSKSWPEDLSFGTSAESVKEPTSTGTSEIEILFICSTIDPDASDCCGLI